MSHIPIFTRYKISSTYQSIIDIMLFAYFLFI